jgi:hypothetical protein
MPKRAGVPNYNNDIFIDIVTRLLPTGAEDWKEVAQLYQVRTKEAEGRDSDDMKRHWVEKLCFKYKKPTGKAGDISNDRILRCQKIQRQIQEKTQSKLYGADEDESEESNSEDSDADVNEATANEEATPSAVTQAATTVVPVVPIIALPAAATTPTVGHDAQATSGVDEGICEQMKKGKTKNSGASQRYSIGKSISEMTAALAARPAQMAQPGLSNESLILFMQQSQQQFLAQQQQQNQQFLMFMEAMKESKKRRRDELED